MKVKIDSNGFLKIQRGTNFKQVVCPLLTDEWCGDWCALFGEPKLINKNILVELCYKTLSVKKEDFEDER